MHICKLYASTYSDSAPPSHGWYLYISIDLGDCVVWLGFGLHYHSCFCKVVITLVDMTIHGCHMKINDVI